MGGGARAAIHGSCFGSGHWRRCGALLCLDVIRWCWGFGCWSVGHACLCVACFGCLIPSIIACAHKSGKRFIHFHPPIDPTPQSKHKLPTCCDRLWLAAAVCAAASPTKKGAQSEPMSCVYVYMCVCVGYDEIDDAHRTRDDGGR